MMTVTLLGNSALIPLPGRAETAATLECDGHMILFDCGEGTQCAARSAGTSVTGADLIALTHYHGDHVFGLPGLLQTMSVLGRTKPLFITGPAGLEEELAPLLTLAGQVNFQVVLISLPPEGIALCDLVKGWPERCRISPFKTQHRVPSQGYTVTLGRAGKFQPEKAMALKVPKECWNKLQRGEPIEAEGVTVTPDMVLGEERKGLKFAFTGDTAPCDAIVQAAANADLLICEATYGENEQTETAVSRGHMTFAQAGQIGLQAGVKRLWLTHFSQRMETPEDFLPNAQVFYPQAECGRDGMRITLAFE